MVGSTTAAEFSPNYRTDMSIHAQDIRDFVLNRPGFSKITPPTGNRSIVYLEGQEPQYSGSGCDVRMQLRLFKVLEVKPAQGAMILKVWLRMYWQDSRLAWDPSQFGNVSRTFFQTAGFSGAEDSEIWIPDIQPYNGLEGTVNTLEPAIADVGSDGQVFLSRPGTLNVMCKFSGLVAFPYDQLICPVEFGGWSFSGGYQGILLHDGGFSISTQEVTSGTSYQEYLIEDVGVKRVNYEYACCPSEPWPVVIYKLKLSRASDFYITVSLFPGMCITLLSFAIFWTDTGSADALGYGISVIIVNLLANLVLIDLLPACGEMIWIDLFSTINTIFCCISLVQSAFNIMCVFVCIRSGPSIQI